MSLGIAEIAIIALCCSAPIFMLLGAGVLFGLLKLGVIGSYWIKGEEPVQQGGDYALNQSQNID